MPIDLNEAAVFVRVVQAGSFSAAARLMGLPTSTLSTRVSRLEKRLGVTLLQRTTRRLNLTEAGAIYFEHASEGLGHMLEAEAAVTESTGEVKGLLRVTAPADIGDTILARIVNRVRQAHPKVSVDLVLMSRYVDLVAEGVDVALRTGILQDSSLIAKPVGIACWAPFASPDYLKSAPPLTQPQQLRQHRCLQFTPLGKEHWTMSNAAGSLTVHMAGNVLVNDVRVIQSMALSGEGVALLPPYLCRNECDDGLLVRVLPDWKAKADPLNIVYPKQRFVPPKLRAFIDIAAEELRAWLS
jgi:DNA-binding transcriptional LysR family regulator